MDSASQQARSVGATPGPSDLTKRVILIGIGGPSCSGKTTLSKLLHRVIPESVLIHQDDFAPLEKDIPVHPIHNVQDWDDPEGAIDWQRMIDFLKDVKSTGEIPGGHASYDHLNVHVEVPISDELVESLRLKFHEYADLFKERGELVSWVLVDGFLLYWHPEIIAQLEAKVFIRVPRLTLKHRREKREYHVAEGVWQDPPGYFEKIVWPAYEKSHVRLFEGGDFQAGKAATSLTIGKPGDPVPGLFVVDGTSTAGNILEQSVHMILHTVSP